MRRYEGLVWSLCRHLLRNDADADDAFQATFLVLIRSAKKIRRTEQLGPWLYGVAYRVCRNARRTAAKRGLREQSAAVAEAGQPVADTAWDETLAAIHEAVNQLPEKLRVPFVLCYLQGKSTTVAATELGLKLGTFSAQLSRAKKAVLSLLAKRGSATMAAVATVAGISASAPTPLVNRVIEFSNSTTAAIPKNLFVLTKGATQMGVSKVQLFAAATVLSASLIAGSYGIWSVKAQPPGAAPAGAPSTPGAAAPGGGFPPGGTAPPRTDSGFPGEPPRWGRTPTMPAAALEYKVVELRGRATAIQNELNKYGNEGWELVSVTSNILNGTELKTAYLKRKKSGVPTGPWNPGMPGGGPPVPGAPGGGPPTLPGVPGTGGPTPPALPGGGGSTPPAPPAAPGAGIGGPTAPSGGGARPRPALAAERLRLLPAPARPTIRPEEPISSGPGRLSRKSRNLGSQPNKAPIMRSMRTPSFSGEIATESWQRHSRAICGPAHGSKSTSTRKPKSWLE